jgi:hypothetical protein
LCVVALHANAPHATVDTLQPPFASQPSASDSTPFVHVLADAQVVVPPGYRHVVASEPSHFDCRHALSLELLVGHAVRVDVGAPVVSVQ